MQASKSIRRHNKCLKKLNKTSQTQLANLKTQLDTLKVENDHQVEQTKILTRVANIDKNLAKLS